jgi:hypothetical protein
MTVTLPSHGDINWDITLNSAITGIDSRLTIAESKAVTIGAVAADILPATDNVYSLGSNAKRFASVHIGPGTLYLTDRTLTSNTAAITINNGVFNINGIAQAQLPNISVTNLTFNDATVQTTAYKPYYGSFESTATQTSGGVTSANLVTFNAVTNSSGTSIDTGATSSKITFANAGTYAIDFNGLYFFSGGASNYNITVWYAKNGNAVANSAYTFTTTSSQSAQVMGHITDLVTVAANDYIQIYWWAAAAGVALTPTAAGTNPTRPASSSATINTWRVA